MVGITINMGVRYHRVNHKHHLPWLARARDFMSEPADSRQLLNFLHVSTYPKSFNPSPIS